MRKLLYIVVIAALLIGCKDNRKFDAALDVADTLMRNQPDSAYRMLLSMSDDAAERSEARRMRHNLLLSDAQNKAYIDFTTDSVMLKVAEYYDHHGSANEQMRSHYLLGCTYRDLHDVPMELQCFQDAVERADTTQKDCDLYTLAAIYGQMADIYHSQLLPEEELKVLKDAEYISLKDKDMLSATKFYELRLRPYYLLNNQDSVLSITKNARNRYLRLNNRQEAAQLLGPAIGILISRNAVDSACRYMDIFERESGYIVDGKIVSTNAKMYYRSKGRMSLLRNQLDSAKYYYTELLNAGWKEAAYEGFVQIYKRTNDIDSLAKYASCFVQENDSARINTNSEVIAQITAMYDYSRHKSNAEKTSKHLAETQASRAMILSILIIVVALTLVGIYLYGRRHRRALEKVRNLSQQLDYYTMLHSNLEKEKDLEISKLRNIIDSKSGDADAENIKREQEMLIETKDNELVALKQRIAQIQQGLELSEVSIKQKAFHESSIYKIFLDCAESGGIEITEHDWNALYKNMRYFFTEYYKYIESSGIPSGNQFKVCMLMRIGIKESGMANILGKTSININNYKRRINERLFGDSSSKALRYNLYKHF